jgi:D-glycero-D-manno-heptose 1,7-bisphosphate phosphatase
MNRRTRLYILDADGTLRWTTVPGQKYPLGRDEWRLMPNVADRLRAIPWSADGPWLAIASNQHGVAEGLITRTAARQLILDALTAALGHIPPGTDIEMCTCREDADCPRRKPAPGMLLGMLERRAVAPQEALFVGDLPIDAEAARRAGIPFAWAQEFFARPAP